MLREDLFVMPALSLAAMGVLRGVIVFVGVHRPERFRERLQLR
jgi:hypothetical protein